MIHQKIDLWEGREDVTLTTYVLDDSPELLRGDPITPVSGACARRIQTRIPSEKENILNRQDQKSRVTGKHRAQNRIVARIPVRARIAEIF